MGTGKAWGRNMPAALIDLGQGAGMPTPTKPFIDAGSWARF